MSLEIAIGGRTVSFTGRDTKQTVLAKLGAPQDTGATSRRHPGPRILKYGDTEFHFDFDDRLVRIYRDTDSAVELSIPFDGL